MFSGIVEELGSVKSFTRQGKVYRLAVEARVILEGTKIGDSISVNGVCLTVVSIDKPVIVFEVMSETAQITTLGRVRVSEKVNLERGLKVGDRVSGHFVLGHVDCAGIIRAKGYEGENLSFEIAIGKEFNAYVIPKGSIAIDGISLTIARKKADSLSVYIIPHTLKNTTLGFKGPSDKVNIEFDILSKRKN
ncbi:MAG: riboflavin synthase [Candidatus Omnitrophota bacterium]